MAYRRQTRLYGMKSSNTIVTGIYGSTVDFADLSSSKIILDDIINRLSAIRRFNGGTKRFYTVAQHSLLLQQLLQADGASARTQQYALLHDMTEAFMGDMISPLKHLFPAFSELEQELLKVICSQLNVPLDFTAEDISKVKILDTEIRLVEWYALNNRQLYDHAYAWRRVYDQFFKLPLEQVEQVEQMSGIDTADVRALFKATWFTCYTEAEIQREQEKKQKI